MRNEKEVQLFTNGEFEVRTKLDEDGVVNCCIDDVAKNLGFEKMEIKNGKEYKSIRWNRIKSYLKPFDQKWSKLKTGDFISESIVYLLAMKAKNDVAIKFQTWLATEVIPDIRKHGMYANEEVVEEMINNPDFTIKLLTEYKNEKEARKLAEEKVGTFLDTKNLMEWNTVAKNLGVGRNDMLKLLRTEKILQTEIYIKNGKKHYGQAHNVPYQKYMKYFKIRYIIKGSKRYPKVLVTAIGQEYLYKRLIKNIHENIA